MRFCASCRALLADSAGTCPTDGAPTELVKELPAGSILRGRYEIQGKLGEGGMAAVYRARHLAFDEPRAVKIVSQRLLEEPSFVKRFRHEAAICRKLHHPNAVRFDDLDTTEDGRPFIVMELVEGRSLREVLREEGPLPWPRAAEIARQAAAALAAAHDLGIVHRDIKPDNLVLRVDEGGRDVVKVLDFGIAKAAEGSLGTGVGYTRTETGLVVGTPQYLSPEQALAKRDAVDGRTDVYSLGVTLYEMLTGKLPFEAQSAMEMMMHHVQTPPRPPQLLRPDLPGALSGLVLRAMQKDPARRFASAGEMEQALFGLVESPEAADAPTAFARNPAGREARTPMPDTRAVPAGRSTPARAPSVAPVSRRATPRPRSAPPPPPASSRGWVLAGIVGLLAIVGGGIALQRQAAPASRGDAAITREVETRLRESGSLDANAVTVRSQDGVVTLEGRVLRQSDSEIAQRMAEAVPGVRSVQNGLAIGEPASSAPPATAAPPPRPEPEPGIAVAATTSDPAPSGEDVVAEVKRALADSDTLRDNSIEVTLVGSTIRLEGSVDSAAEAEVALAVAKSAASGRAVSARLQYTAARPSPPPTTTAAQPQAEPPFGGGPPPFGRGPQFRPVHEAMRRGDYAEAERLLNEILRGNSGDADAREFMDEVRRRKQERR